MTDLADLHERPWSKIKNVRVVIRTDNSDPFLPDGPTGPTIREGEVVGRSVGMGLYYMDKTDELIEEEIGPRIYIETVDDGILEIRTDDYHKLLEIDG